MTLRVAHVLNSPGLGGVPRVARALVGHLQAAGIANHVFYLKTGEGADLFDDIDLPRRTASSASKATAMIELVAWLDAHRIDILHTHSFRPNLYARMAGAVLKPAGLKMVAHYHNDYTDKWHDDALLIERRLAPLTDAALAVSQPVACHVTDKSGLAPEVLPNGIDLDRVTGGDRARGRAALGLPPDVHAVGLVGRICRQKGVDTFVDAAIRLCHRMVDARFVVIGDPEDPDLSRKLHTRIDGAGLTHRITLAGHHDVMADVYAALDLLVAPSRWEGFGLVLAEAMAAGLPVVASEVGGIPEVVGQAARLVAGEDPAALVAALEAVLTDPAARETLVQAGCQRARRFNWARSAEQLETLYRRLEPRR